MRLQIILVSLVFLLEAWASPTFRNSSAFVVPITSRRRAGIPRAIKYRASDAEDIPFDPQYAKREMRGLLAKYRDPKKILQSVTGTGTPSHNLNSPASAAHSLAAVSSVESPIDNSETPLIQTPPTPPVLITSGVAKMPLRDMISGTMDLLYYGPLLFGTPPQELTVDVDTGSADLWVPSDCASCANKQFDKRASSTYEDKGARFDVSYGSGDVSAMLVTDVVSIQGLSVRKQAFGAVSSESEDFNGYPNSGLLGMAFSSIAANGQTTFFENLIKEKQLASPMFSVHLARGQETGSEVCFGCLDKSKTIGDVSWVPVISKTYWAVALDGMSVNDTVAPANAVVAAIDTGTTLIYLPEDLATRLYALIPGSKPAPVYGPEFYTYPCDEDFIVSISFGGNNFAINSNDFNMGPIGDGSRDCVGGVLSLGNGFPPNLAIVGDEFLKSWYSTFDYSNGARIGFSPSVNNRKSKSWP